MRYSKTLFLGTLLLLGAAAGSLYFWEKDLVLQGITPPETQEIASADPKEEKPAHEEHEEGVIKWTEQQMQQMGLTIQVAGFGTIKQVISTRGKIILEPDRLAHVIPKVTGIAKDVYKNIGDIVRTGEMMAVLESSEMADAKAAYLAVLAKSRLAYSSFMREEKLYREQISAAQDYLNAQNQYEEAVINVQLAEQKLLALGLTLPEIHDLAQQKNPSLRFYEVRAPLDGTVIMRHITQGEFIENTKTIYEVANLSTVWVEIGIYPRDLDRVKVGQSIDVMLPIGQQSAEARLIYVSPIVTNETITATAVAQLDNARGLWRPGVFVKVDILVDTLSFPIVIPTEAIQDIDGEKVVFVVTSKGIEKRKVKLGLSGRENVEVLEGLQPGERYVATQTFLIKAELGKGAVDHDD